jgi:gas vesicle protein
MSQGTGSNLGFFLAGFGLGTLVAALFAPKSGKETREYLTGKAAEGREYVKGKTEDLCRQGQRLADQGREYVNTQTKELRRQAEEAVETAKDLIT